MSRKEPKMTDKERILTHIIRGIQTGTVLGKSRHAVAKPYSSERFEEFRGDGHYPHFAPWKDAEVGDLVICNTGFTHEATIGIVHQTISGSEMIIRGVGNDYLTRISNERFVPIVGFDLSSSDFLVNKERRFFQKIEKAIGKSGHYFYRFGGVSIDGKNAVITIRPHIFVQDCQETVDISIEWNSKTTIKQIREALVGGGLGTKWEKENDPQ